jgi:hypothetical protein
MENFEKKLADAIDPKGNEFTEADEEALKRITKEKQIAHEKEMLEGSPETPDDKDHEFTKEDAEFLANN